MADINAKVKEANIKYHAKLAPVYAETQPHYLPENKKRVSAILESLAEKTGGGRLLDIGCGSGFILELAEPYFDEVVGIDITQEMLARVKKSPKIKTLLADSEKMPFEKGYFDVCTSYSFLHHLYTLPPTLAEIHRVLKPGGAYYADQDPNYYYFEMMNSLAGHAGGIRPGSLLQYELNPLSKVQDDVEKKYGIDGETTKFSEYQEVKLGGLREEELFAQFGSAGFSGAEITYRWFVGQSRFRNEFGEAAAQRVHDYLSGTLPVSRPYFKYVQVIATK